MKKMICLTLIAVTLLTLLAVPALAGDAWYCAACDEYRSEEYCPVCGARRSPLSGKSESGGPWPQMEYDGIKTALSPKGDSSKRHQSWFAPDRLVGAGAYKPSKVVKAVALFREGDFVLVDLTYETVGRRCVYFKASSLTRSNVASLVLDPVTASVSTAVQPRFGPGDDYNGVTINQKNKNAGKIVSRSVILDEDINVSVYFEMDGWVFCGFKCSLGFIRAWLPADCVKVE